MNKRFSECFNQDIYQSYFDFQKEFLEKYDKKLCEFQDNQVCKALEKYQYGKNGFKGVLENDQVAAILLNLGTKGSSSAYGAEQLFIFDKRKKARLEYYFL